MPSLSVAAMPATSETRRPVRQTALPCPVWQVLELWDWSFAQRDADEPLWVPRRIGSLGGWAHSQRRLDSARFTPGSKDGATSSCGPYSVSSGV